MSTTTESVSDRARLARRWRVVELVVASVLGVASGLLFIAWNAQYAALSAPLSALPAVSLLGGAWLLPGVLGGLVVRRPGAAICVSLLAATVSGLAGSQWGFSVIYYGFIQGLGAELIFATFRYRRFGLPTAAIAGAGAALAIGPVDVLVYYRTFAPGWMAVYQGCLLVSGAVIAGGGGWALTRALAATGVLAPLASGRAVDRV